MAKNSYVERLLQVFSDLNYCKIYNTMVLRFLLRSGTYRFIFQCESFVIRNAAIKHKKAKNNKAAKNNQI